MEKRVPFTFCILLLVLTSCADRSLSDEHLTRYRKAKTLYLEGEFERAESRFRAIVAEAPRFYQANFMLAKTLGLQDKRKASIAVLRKVLKAHPQYHGAEIWLVRMLIQEDMLKKAQERITALLGYDASDPRLLYLQALIHQKNENDSAAIELLKQATIYREEYVRISLDLARLYFRYQMNDLAVEELNLTLTLLPESSPLYKPVQQLQKKITEEEIDQ